MELYFCCIFDISRTSNLKIIELNCIFAIYRVKNTFWRRRKSGMISILKRNSQNRGRRQDAKNFWFRLDFLGAIIIHWICWCIWRIRRRFAVKNVICRNENKIYVFFFADFGKFFWTLKKFVKNELKNW